MTVRKRIIDLITGNPVTLREISQAVGISEKEVPDHLIHIQNTAKAQGLALVIDPPSCLTCDFTFMTRKRFTRPSRCPECKGERIDDPLFHLK